MRRLLIVAAAVALAGCSMSTEGWRIAQFEKQCADHGGIHEVGTFLATYGICQDGAVVRAHRPEAK